MKEVVGTLILTYLLLCSLKCHFHLFVPSCGHLCNVTQTMQTIWLYLLNLCSPSKGCPCWHSKIPCLALSPLPCLGLGRLGVWKKLKVTQILLLLLWLHTSFEALDWGYHQLNLGSVSLLYSHHIFWSFAEDPDYLLNCHWNKQNTFL